MIMSLEPRMLFDGAVAATVAEAAQPDSQPTSDASAKSAEQANSATDHHTQAQASSDVAAPPAACLAAPSCSSTHA